MATAKEIKAHLNLALKEVGEITPWFDKDVNEWIFSHPLYPVEYGGETKEEVIQNYPKYLREFVVQRLNDNLNPFTEKKTKGRGGIREGAGRPVGTNKEHKSRVYLPDDIAEWIKTPGIIPNLRLIMQTYKHV